MSRAGAAKVARRSEVVRQGELFAPPPKVGMPSRRTPKDPPGREDDAIDVLVPGSADDPRIDTSIPGVVIHRGPPLHPDDVTTHKGIPVTSPSRTLIDCAEVMSAAELRATFARARELGLLDPGALRASRARVEWRPSLAMLDEVIEEFCGPVP